MNVLIDFQGTNEIVCDTGGHSASLYQIISLMCIVHKFVCFLLNHSVFICNSQIHWKNEIRIYKTV